MGNCSFGQCRKQIISEKALGAVRNVVEYLKENVRLREIFRSTRHDQRVQQIAREIARGSPSLYRTLDESSVRDVAAALQYFLIYLRKPLVPLHIQALVLENENRTVTPELIAQDVLGLLKQDLEERHLELLKIILDLLYNILTCSPCDELSGCNVPISMLPIFFQMQAEHLVQWRSVATIFVELIRLAPGYLDIQLTDHLEEREMVVENFVAPREYYSRANNAVLQQRLNDMNVMLRRYLVRTACRGDSSSFEIYQPASRTNINNRYRRQRQL